MIISVDKEQAQKAGNLLYQELALMIQAKQDFDTGELKDVKLLSFENDFKPKYDEDALNEIIERVSPQWKDTSVDEWSNEIRGENA